MFSCWPNDKQMTQILSIFSGTIDLIINNKWLWITHWKTNCTHTPIFLRLMDSLVMFFFPNNNHDNANCSVVTFPSFWEFVPARVTASLLKTQADGGKQRPAKDTHRLLCKGLCPRLNLDWYSPPVSSPVRILPRHRGTPHTSLQPSR